MTAPRTGGGVFLSYASQDGGAARCVSDALRAAGIEVWLDQNELRGGDAWDRRIRRQIRECALFLPVISSRTQLRKEGYFRLEWRLAVERMQRMSDGAAFLVPVVIDKTSEHSADVPEVFKSVQWARLPDGDTTKQFVDLILSLLESTKADAAEDYATTAATPAVSSPTSVRRKSRSASWLATETSSSRRAVGVGIALAGALALATVIAVVLLQPSSRETAKADASAGAPQRAAPVAAQATAQSTPRSHSIAVLPFANLSPNETDAYFAIGIHEDILNQLTKLGSLRVIARTTVQQYVGTQKTISAIARELNVETVMEGSVRYADGRVLVTTQLIDGATDLQLWSEKYDREFNNIFAIQSDIAVEVAQALKTELLPADRERIDRVPTTSLRAYDLYLSATARGRRQTWPEIQLGIEEVDEAIAIDPNFASAWALKADLRSIAPYFDPARAAEHQALGAEAARRAVELDPTLGNAHAALGFALFTLGDWRGSEAAFRTALSLNTPLGDMAAYSPMQLAVGNFAYAREILQEARESVPQNPSALAFLVLANALLGEWETATEQYELGTRLFTPWGLGDSLMTYLLVGRNELDAARRISPSSELDAAMLANLDTPQAALLDLRRRYDDADAPGTRGGIAPWAAHFGDPALALEAIRAAATQQGGILWFVWLPQFAEARRLPQFKTLIRDLGVVAYWQEYGWPAVCRPRGTNDFDCD